MGRFRILSAIVAVFAIALCCVVGVGAEETGLGYAFSAVCGETSDTFDGIPVPEDAVPLSDDENLPTSIFGSSPMLFMVDGERYVSVVADREKNSTSLIYDVAPSEVSPDDSDTADSEPAADTPPQSVPTVGIGLYVPVGDRGDTPLCTVSVMIRVKYTEGLSTHKVTCVAGAPAVVFCDTSEDSEGKTIEKVTLTLSGMGFLPERVYTTLPFSTENVDFSFQRKNSLTGVSVLSGSGNISDGVLTLSPSANGNCELWVSTMSTKGYSADVPYGQIVYLEADASTGSGSVALLGDDGKSHIGTPASLSADGGELLMRLTEEERTWDARLQVRIDSEDPFSVSRLRFVPTGERQTPESEVISTMTLENGELRVDGRLDEEAAREHMGRKLGLYMRPAFGGSTPVLLGNVSVSSRFSFKLQMKEYESSAMDSLYFVGVDVGDGVIKQLSTPRFANVRSTVSSSGTFFGLYGSDPISVYESGAPRVMVDVDLTKLLYGGISSGAVVSYGGYSFGLNQEYAKELEADVGFYISSGAEVYLKLICTSPVRASDGSWLMNINRSVREYMVLTGKSEAVCYFLAGVSYLCERFPETRSIVITSGVNSVSLTGMEPTNLYEYVSGVAMLARLTYGVASRYGDGIYVTLPLAETGTFATPELLGALFAERLSVLGQMTWAPMYTVTDEMRTERIDTVGAVTKSCGTATPAFAVVCWTPEGDGSSVPQRYESLCDVVDSAVRAIFLSAERLSSGPEREDYRALREANRAEGTFLLYENTVNGEKLSSLNITGHYTQWDFTELYSTDGWLSGYGIEYLGTVEAKGGDRVLRCKTGAQDGESSGFMLCTLPTPINVTRSPFAEFVFSYTSELPVQITFLLGSGENRIEFSCSETETRPDGKVRALCDLSEFAPRSAVEYVGIIIRGEGEVTFDLSEVSFLSESASDGELERLMHTDAAEDMGEARLSAAELSAVALAVLICLTVYVRLIMVMSKKDSGARRREK